MNELSVQQSIDALIDDVDAPFVASRLPLTPPALARDDRANAPVAHAGVARTTVSGAKSAVVVRTSKRAIVLSTLIGFIAGAVCWHLLGFWWFISDVMFHRRGEPVAQLSRPAAMSLKAQSRQGGVASPTDSANLERCSIAARDGSASETTIGVCDAVGARFRPARGLGKADLGDFGPTPVPTLISGTPPLAPSVGSAAVGGWSASVEKTLAPQAGQ